MAVTVSVSVAMTVTLAMSMSVSVTVGLAVSMRNTHEKVKLAGGLLWQVAHRVSVHGRGRWPCP